MPTFQILYMRTFYLSLASHGSLRGTPDILLLLHISPRETETRTIELHWVEQNTNIFRTLIQFKESNLLNASRHLCNTETYFVQYTRLGNGLWHILLYSIPALTMIYGIYWRKTNVFFFWLIHYILTSNIFTTGTPQVIYSILKGNHPITGVISWYYIWFSFRGFDSHIKIKYMFPSDFNLNVWRGHKNTTHYSMFSLMRLWYDENDGQASIPKCRTAVLRCQRVVLESRTVVLESYRLAYYRFVPSCPKAIHPY